MPLPNGLIDLLRSRRQPHFTSWKDEVTLKEAAKQGISRVRLPEWEDPSDYLEIDINPDGTLGMWGHFNNPDGRQDIPIFFGTSERWVPFDMVPKAKF